MVHTFIAKRNKSQSADFARPDHAHAKSMFWPAWYPQAYSTEHSCFRSSGPPSNSAGPISAVATWTVALSRGCCAVSLSSGFTAHICSYRGLCLFGSAFAAVVVSALDDYFWLFRAAWLIAFSIRTLPYNMTSSWTSFLTVFKMSNSSR